MYKTSGLSGGRSSKDSGFSKYMPALKSLRKDFVSDLILHPSVFLWDSSLTPNDV